MNLDDINKLILKINDLIEQKEHNEEIISNVIVEIREAIKYDHSFGKILGQYIPQLQKLLVKKTVENIIFLPRKRQYSEEEKKSNPVKIANGYLMIGHKPQSIPKLKTQYNIDTILTILSKREGAENIGQACIQNNIDWLWLELSNGNNPPKSKHKEIFDLFDKLKQKLNNNSKIFIHCSAGIHRTGMITFAFLIYFGFNEKEAFDILYKLRAVTAHEVKQKRLKWGIKLILNH